MLEKLFIAFIKFHLAVHLYLKSVACDLSICSWMTLFLFLKP